jgi:hypothetical protein
MPAAPTGSGARDRGRPQRRRPSCRGAPRSGSRCSTGTGVIARRRVPAATPGTVALVGALTGLVALAAAVVAVPSVGAGGSMYGYSSLAGMHFVFDLGQAFRVGGLAIVITTLAGFRYGGGAAARMPIPQ